MPHIRKSLLDFMNYNNALLTAGNLRVWQRGSQDTVPTRRKALSDHDGVYFQEDFPLQSHPPCTTHVLRPFISSRDRKIAMLLNSL